ncbi:MAG: mannose-1-phosphate guanylyltransferase [Candidatus Cryptobacteroides sp.]|jgi:mannose-1-phosphate guanylyltransferase
MKNNRYCVIMAGGSGNRFWPVSRESRPKQFLDIVGTDKSFLQITYERFSKFIPKENILVVTLSRYSHLVTEQIPDLPKNNLLLEPYSRNTGPCLVYATYRLLKRNPDAVMLATPADHLILDEDLFEKTLGHVLDHVEAHDVLMTLGITPTKPDISYGYIQISGGKASATADKPFKVKTFTEKPDQTLAEVFCKSGEFYWNSGIFAWKASVIREEMEKHIPEITSLFKGWEEALETPKEIPFLEKVYGDCPKISIDYGVMEKTDRAWLYPGHFGWTDIGSWRGLFKIFPDKDRNGNAVNAGWTLLRDNKDNLIYSRDRNKLIAVKGLRGYMVINTEDALLVCPRDQRSFKDILADLGMPEYEKFR